MTSDPGRRLVVGRFRKPHGLKGEVNIFPLTDDPDLVFAVGRSVWLVDLAGAVVDGPLVIERSRGYHRERLVTFKGYATRDAIEGWRNLLLAAPAESLRPPEAGEVYLHELVGFAVQDAAGAGLGLVSDVDEMPGGVMLEVQGHKREFLLPFRKEFVKEVDRDGRRLVVDLPDGLIE